MKYFLTISHIIFVSSVFSTSNFLTKFAQIMQEVDGDLTCLYTRWGRDFKKFDTTSTKKYQAQIIISAESRPIFLVTKFLQKYGKICNFIHYKGVTASLSRRNMPVNFVQFGSRSTNFHLVACKNLREADSYPFSGYANVIFVVGEKFKIYGFDVYGEHLMQRGESEGRFYRDRSNFQGRQVKWGYPPVGRLILTKDALQSFR